MENKALNAKISRMHFLRSADHDDRPCREAARRRRVQSKAESRESGKVCVMWTDWYQWYSLVLAHYVTHSTTDKGQGHKPDESSWSFFLLLPDGQDKANCVNVYVQRLVIQKTLTKMWRIAEFKSNKFTHTWMEGKDFLIVHQM